MCANKGLHKVGIEGKGGSSVISGIGTCPLHLVIEEEEKRSLGKRKSVSRNS